MLKQFVKEYFEAVIPQRVRELPSYISICTRKRYCEIEFHAARSIKERKEEEVLRDALQYCASNPPIEVARAIDLTGREHHSNFTVPVDDLAGFREEQLNTLPRTRFCDRWLSFGIGVAMRGSHLGNRARVICNNGPNL